MKFQQDRELEIKERQAECKRKRENIACALEESARKVRTSCLEAEAINDEYISVATELESSDTGTLNLSACPLPQNVSNNSYVFLLQKARAYRDMAEQLRADNRKLQLETCEKVEAIRNFWRNNILEERTRAGKMLMTALRNPKHLHVTSPFH